jgi:hypothetical protein
MRFGGAFTRDGRGGKALGVRSKGKGGGKQVSGFRFRHRCKQKSGDLHVLTIVKTSK